MSDYTIAPSVRAALDQATALWPQRSKASDGTIGDARHQAEPGGSDHNPDANGIVHAYDLTHDPAHGCDCNALADQLAKRVLRGAEFRVKYLIWNRRIFNPSISMLWRPYTGTDPHTNHLHCSILSGSGAENNTSPWWLPIAPPSPPTLLLEADMKFKDENDEIAWQVNFAYTTLLGRPVESLQELAQRMDQVRSDGYARVWDDLAKSDEAVAYLAHR